MCFPCRHRLTIQKTKKTNDKSGVQQMQSNLNNLEENWGSSSQSKRTERIIEVSVFLFLIVPSMAFSFFAVKQGSIGFRLVAVATMLRDLALVSLILFFVWRNDEAVAQIGWRFQNAWREVLLGLVLFIPFFFGANLLESALLGMGFSTPSTPLPSLEATGGIGESVLGFFLVAIVALTEETIFRGYLILRFKAIRSSAVFAVIFSSVIFSLGHGYEGSAGVITVGFMGMVFAIIYLWRRSLMAPMVMHFLQDFIGIVLLPLLQMK